MLLSACLFCPQVKCAFLLTLDVRDVAGRPVNDFAATVGTVSATCSGCGGMLTVVLGSSDEVMIAIDAGTRSASLTVTPDYLTASDPTGCSGCPEATVPVTVR